jgi:hypothetical protein
MAPLPSLFEAREGLVMQLGNTRRRHGEDFRDVAERDALQVMKNDHDGLGLGQTAEALKDGAAVLGAKHGGVGAGSIGIGQALLQREAFLAVAILGYFVEGDQLTRLGLRLVGGEVGFVYAQRRREFHPGRFAFELLG